MIVDVTVEGPKPEATRERRERGGSRFLSIDWSHGTSSRSYPSQAKPQPQNDAYMPRPWGLVCAFGDAAVKAEPGSDGRAKLHDTRQRNLGMPDPASADLSIAMIGAGFISDYHVSGLRTAGGASVDALVGRDRLRTEARAKALHIPRVETDYRTVLYDRSIDAVVIATPDNTHERIASEALAAGKAVLLQKPMALNGDECRRILKARASYDGQLSVSFMHRYFQEVRWLRDLLAKGSLEESTRFGSSRMPPLAPTGATGSTRRSKVEASRRREAMQLGCTGSMSAVTYSAKSKA